MGNLTFKNIIINIITTMADSAATTSGMKKVKLQSSDNESFDVDQDVACRSVLIKNMLEDIGETDEAIPLPNVSSSVLQKVLDWCEHHRKDPEPLPEDADDSRKKSTEIPDWDKKF